MLSARDADPGAHQKEKKSVLADYIVSKGRWYYLTITLRLPYVEPLIFDFRVAVCQILPVLAIFYDLHKLFTHTAGLQPVPGMPPGLPGSSQKISRPLQKIMSRAVQNLL